MTGYQSAYFSLLAFCAIYVLIAVCSSTGIRSAFAFFHNSSKHDNTISLIAANIALGSGVVYLVSGGQQNGILMLSVPIATLIGYFLLASSYSVAQSVLKPGETVLESVQNNLNLIYNKKGPPPPFARSVSLCLVFGYSLFLGYELVASPRIIAPFVSVSPGPYAEPLIALYLFLAALFTVMFGGIRGVFRTDKVQILAVVIVVLLLVSVASSVASTEEQIKYDLIIRYDLDTIINVITFAIMAIATQFFSILNMATASHLTFENRPQTFRIVGIYVGIILFILVMCGIVAQSHGLDITEFIAKGYGEIGKNKGIFPVILGIFVSFGLTSVICSTADSLMMAISQFAYNDLWGKDSGDKGTNFVVIKHIRITIFFAFSIVFVIIALLFWFQPNLVYLLMAMVSPVSIFAPLSALLMLLLSKPYQMRVLTVDVLRCYIVLFFILALTAFSVFFLFGDLVKWVGIFSFLLSCILTIIVWLKARKITEILEIT